MLLSWHICAVWLKVIKSLHVISLMWILWMHMKENVFLPLHNGEAGLDEPFPNLRRLYIKCVMTIQMNHYCLLQKTVSMSFMCISMHVLLYLPLGHWLSINFTNNCGPLILERNICWQKATYKIVKPSRVKIFILSYFTNRFQCTQDQYLNFLKIFKSFRSGLE